MLTLISVISRGILCPERGQFADKIGQLRNSRLIYTTKILKRRKRKRVAKIKTRVYVAFNSSLFYIEARRNYRESKVYLMQYDQKLLRNLRYIFPELNNDLWFTL